MEKNSIRSGCAIPECDKPGRLTRGWCGMHYARWLLRGDPLDGGKGVGSKPIPAEERFWPKVDKTTSALGCWLWTGAIGAGNYGFFNFRGTMKRAHRVSYILAHGEIPKGLVIDHKLSHLGCPRHCVNPEHLQAVTQKENLENLARARKGNPSGVRGVCWDSSRELWLARVQHNYRGHFVGYYPLYELHVADYYARLRRNELFTNNVSDR